MLDWEEVDGGRARPLLLTDTEAAWVRVADDGTVHIFTGVTSADELAPAVPAGGFDAFVDRMTALDTIDVVSRSLGGDDPGPMAHG